MRRLRVLCVAHTYVVPWQRAKLKHLAAYADLDLHVLVPSRWRGMLGAQAAGRGSGTYHGADAAARGYTLVLRVIGDKTPELSKLGLPESIRRVLSYRDGLVLVTGPTGSGKSTTLAAMIDLINTNRSEHIITIEDPIEFVHPNKSCAVGTSISGLVSDLAVAQSAAGYAHERAKDLPTHAQRD